MRTSDHITLRWSPKDQIRGSVCECACVHCTWLLSRVGQHRIYTPYMTVYLVVFLPKIPYLHRIPNVLANPIHVRSSYLLVHGMEHVYTPGNVQAAIFCILPALNVKKRQARLWCNAWDVRLCTCMSVYMCVCVRACMCMCACV
jgi:hypothetical protein